MTSRNKGFTIVELLIVIVVIAVLAAISIVAYNGIQKRAITSLVKDALSTKSRQLELDKVDRGTYADNLSQLASDINSSEDGVSFDYSVNGGGDERAYCLSAVRDKIAFHITNSSSASAEPGVCEGHNDPNAAPPEIVHSSIDQYNLVESTTDTWVSTTINYDIEPSDLVLVLYNSAYNANVHTVRAGSTDFQQVYRKTMGPSGYQQTVLYRATGLSGPQTIETRLCWYVQCNYGSATLKGKYIVYVVRGKNSPVITYTDTSYGSQTRGSTVSPAPISISRNDIAIYAYVHFGNYLPQRTDSSSPALDWHISGEKTSAVSREDLSVMYARAETSGTVAQSLLMPSSGSVYAGATMFIVK